MSEECKLPCLPPPACTGTAVLADSCTPCSATVGPDICPVPDMCPCPEQPPGTDPCQPAASCPDACGSACPPPAVPIPGDTCDPCTSPCVTACVCPAAVPCDLQQCQAEASTPLQPCASPAAPCTPEATGTCVEAFPHQHIVSLEHPCILETAGIYVETCTETFPQEHAVSPVEFCVLETDGTRVETLPVSHPASPCTIEVLEGCTETPTLICTEDPTCPQGVPCPEHGSVPCVEENQHHAEPQSPTKSTGRAASPRAPFRLHTRTAAIVERCLARCQGWLRGKK